MPSGGGVRTVRELTAAFAIAAILETLGEGEKRIFKIGKERKVAERGLHPPSARGQARKMRLRSASCQISILGVVLFALASEMESTLYATFTLACFVAPAVTNLSLIHI